jgi:isoprenylcysteine carboxyl methyltransferase (ICMT) family protein YpbQ
MELNFVFHLSFMSLKNVLFFIVHTVVENIKFQISANVKYTEEEVFNICKHETYFIVASGGLKLM